jgi:hypothetical protein
MIKAGTFIPAFLLSRPSEENKEASCAYDGREASCYGGAALTKSEAFY